MTSFVDRRFMMGIMLACLSFRMAKGQAPAAAVVEEEVENPQAAVEAMEARPIPPAPGEDVMHATEHGIRLTPAFAEMISRQWLRHQVPGLKADDKTKDELARGLARRLMLTADKYGEVGRDFAEFAYGALIETDGRFSAETSRPFAEHCKPVLPAFEELVDGADEEARATLDPADYEHLSQKLDEIRQSLKTTKEMMDRWARGEYREGDRPFDDSPPAPAEGQTDKEREAAETMRNLEMQWNWQRRQLGPEAWERFLKQTINWFQLNEEQQGRGRELLAEYRAKAEPIMTPEWETRIKHNRMQSLMRWRLEEKAVGPWVYHLDKEYEEAVKPIEELGEAFRKDVLGLVTQEQRDKALADLIAKGVEHGMTPEETAALADCTKPD